MKFGEKNMRKLKEIIVGLLLVGFFTAGVAQVLDTPEVYISQSTGECVDVKSPNKNDKCDNLPQRYSQIYVK